MNNKVRIGSFCKVRRGASPRPIDNPNYFGGDVGWIRISDVTKSFKYLNKTEQYVSPLGESLSVRVDKGDLIMSICGTIGRPIIINIPSCIHDGFVQLYDIQEANKEYLYYILQHHEKDLERKGQPGTQVNLNTTIVENFEIYFPAKSIQTKIAKILSTADAVIEKTQAAIAKYKAIKQGMLYDLFTRGISSTGSDTTGRLRPRYEDAPELYKESKLGMIPREWDEKVFGKEVDLIHGHQFRDYDFTEFGIPVVKIGQVKPENVDLTNCSFVRAGREEEFQNEIIRNGDVLMALTGATLGKACLVKRLNGIVFQNYRVGRFEPIIKENDIDKEFLYYLLIAGDLLTQIFNKVNTGAQGNIGKADFEKATFKKPPFKEQQIIAERLKAIDNKLQTEQTYLQKMQSLKKGLMEDLLSGKKQVKVLKSETSNSEVNA